LTFRVINSKIQNITKKYTVQIAVQSEENSIMKLKNTDEKINKKPIYKNIIGIGVSAMLGIFALTGCDNTEFEDNTSDGIAQNVDVNTANPEETESTEEQESPEFSAEIDPANFEIVPEWSVEEKMELAERLLQAFRRDGSDVFVYYIGDQPVTHDTNGNVYEFADPYKCQIYYSKDRDCDGKVDYRGTDRVTYSDIDVKYQQLEN